MESNSAKRLLNILKYLLVVLVVAFISTLFPNTVRFKYHFERGRTWNYNDLVASFDFSVQKNDLEAQNDLDQQEEAFSPYYVLNFEVGEQQIQRFTKAFEVQVEAAELDNQYQDVLKSPEKYKLYGQKFLARIYQQGIISWAKPNQAESSDFVIQVIRGNTTAQEVAENILTVAAVKNLLIDSLPYSNLKEAEFIYPILEQHIVPNIFYSSERTEQFKADYLSTVTTTKDLVSAGELIVAAGATITDEVYDQLISYKVAYEQEVSKERSKIGIFIGYFLMISLIMGVFLLYLQRYAHEHFNQIGKFIFLLSPILLYSCLVFLVNQVSFLNAYMIPFCIIPIVIKHFFDSRLALYTHLTVVLIASFLTSLGYEFTFIQIIAGIVAVVGNVNSRELSEFFNSILFIFFAYALTFIGLSLIQEGKIMPSDGQIIWTLFINVSLVLLAYPMIPVLERLFGFTSVSSLIELSSTNRPLIKKLIQEVPGTWQHSLQVANLSEAAATAIGADAMLVKVGALYHDIGKTLTPEYFIENQQGINPHDTLTPKQSVEKIIAHVAEGVKLAKKSHVPKAIIDFIETHHGTTKVEYFYRKYKEENPEATPDEQQFRYPGTKPSTKEQAVLMIADSIEAASRTLQNPTVQDITQLIDRIITHKITDKQLEHSELTFKELEQCRTVFQQMLTSLYHTRVEYPQDIETEVSEV